jgi:hypothetical protein
MEIGDILPDLQNRQLNLNKVLKLPESDRKIIIDLFNDFMNSCQYRSDNFSVGGLSIKDPFRAPCRW